MRLRDSKYRIPWRRGSPTKLGLNKYRTCTPKTFGKKLRAN